MLSPAAPQQRDSGTDRHELAAVDPRLARLCAAWASLPEHVVLAILALVDAAGVVEAVRLQPPSQDLEWANGNGLLGDPEPMRGRQGPWQR